MKTHSAFSKIGQFRQVVTEAILRAQYIGKDSNGDPIYDDRILAPIITFKGTIKLHGTNGGVSHTGQDGIWAQSREDIVTPEEDNKGFAKFVESKRDSFVNLIYLVRYHNAQINPNDRVTIFGEWVGIGIQKGVAISKIDKAFFIFAVKVAPEDGSKSYYLDSDYLRDTENRIFNIEDFNTYSIEIDFNNPGLVQDRLMEITNAIDESCPVGKAFGIEGAGEGIVWVANLGDHRYQFKVKGEKHQVARTKTPVEIDTVKMSLISEFVDYAVTPNRFEQGMSIVFPSGIIDITKMGDIIKWVSTDVLTEESDVLKDNGLEPKEVNKHISNKVRKMFFEVYNKL